MGDNAIGKIRFDAAMTPQALTAQAETISGYYDMSKYKRAIFIIEHSSMQNAYGTTGGIVLRRLQATSSTGANAIIAGSSAELAMGSTYTVSSTSYVYTKASQCILTCNTSVASGDTVTINSVTFTVGAAGGTSELASTRLIVTSSGPNACEHLAAYINSAAYGVSGVKATVASNVITLTGDETPLTITITGTNTSGGFFVTGARGVGYLAIDSAEIAASSSFRYVAVGITPGSSATFAVTLLRTGARYSIPSANIHGDDWIAGG